MKINIKKYIITFFILIVTFVIGAEQKIPNVMVLENPVKEVTTIEGLKNKEAAEMNIKVKKRDIEEIEGIETKDGFEFTFPKDKMDASEKIIAINNTGDFSDSKVKAKLMNQSIDTTFNDNKDNFILKMSKENDFSNIYFVKYNDLTKEVTKLYKGKIQVKAPSNIGFIRYVNHIPIEVLLKLDSKGEIKNKKFSIWNRRLAAEEIEKSTGISRGEENKQIRVKKMTGFVSNEEMVATITNYLELEGTSEIEDPIPSKVDYGSNGKFEKTPNSFYLKALKASGLRSPGATYVRGYSKMYQTFEGEVDTSNSKIESVGVFETKGEGNVDFSHFYSYGQYERSVSTGNWHTTPVRFVIQRESKNLNLVVRPNDLLGDNSLSFSKLKSILGYDPYRRESSVRYTLENITPGADFKMAMNNLTYNGILFPKNIKAGVYKIRIYWKTESGTPINGPDGDVLTINFQKNDYLRAKLDLTEFSVGTFGKWRPMASGEGAQTSEGAPYSMDIIGNLPDIRNISGKSEVVKLLVGVTKDGVEQPQVTVHSAENSRIVVELEDNILGYESNGDFFITKKKKSKKTYVYRIFAYDKNGRNVASINQLEVINDKPIDIGRVVYSIDERLYPKHIGWFDKNGQKFSSIPANFKNIDNYEELINYYTSRFSYPHGVTLTAEGIVGLTKKSEVNGKGFIYGTPGTIKGDTIIPDNVTSEEDFGQKLYVLNNDNIASGTSITHKLEYIGSDNKYYFIEVFEARGNQKVASGGGGIDLSKIKTIGAVHSFSKKLKPGKYTSNGAELSITGNLPQTQGYKKENIVNNLDIIVNGGAPLNVVGNSYENDNYRITLNKDSGDLEVEKLNIDNLYNDTIDITYKYQDIKLGDFRLNVKNEGIFFEIIGDDSINFGEIIQGKDSEIDGKIIVKNLNSKRIVKVEENTNRRLKMKKKDSSILLNVYETITLLRKETEAPIEIRMTAKPKPDQSVGEYEGELNLYIYIE